MSAKKRTSLAQRHAEQVRASRLRRRRVEGRQLSDADRAWLDTYEGRVTGGRPRELVSKPKELAAAELPAAAAAPQDTAPDAAGSLPAAGETPPPADAPPASEQPAAKQEAPSLAPVPGLLAGQADEEGDDLLEALDPKMLAGLGDAYADWLKDVTGRAAAAGWPALPASIFERIVRPACRRQASKASAWLNAKGVDEESADLAIIAIPTVEVLAFRYVETRKAKSTPAAATVATTAAAVAASTPPATAAPPPPATLQPEPESVPSAYSIG